MSTQALTTSSHLKEMVLPQSKAQGALCVVSLVGILTLIVGIMALFASTHHFSQSLNFLNDFGKVHSIGGWVFSGAGLVAVGVSSCLFVLEKKRALPSKNVEEKQMDLAEEKKIKMIPMDLSAFDENQSKGNWINAYKLERYKLTPFQNPSFEGMLKKPKKVETLNDFISIEFEDSFDPKHVYTSENSIGIEGLNEKSQTEIYCIPLTHQGLQDTKIQNGYEKLILTYHPELHKLCIILPEPQKEG